MTVSCLLLAAPAQAQLIDLDDPLAEYLRLLQLSGHAVPGSFTVLPSVEPLLAGLGSVHPWSLRFPISAAPTDDGPQITLRDVRLRAFLNSRHPAGRNDGVVWQGKGLTSALDFGAALRWGGLSVTLQPTATFAQNSDFELAPVAAAGMPTVAYPWRVIDLPQRFGPESLWQLDAGQSEVSFTWRAAQLGFGTRNLWWGPGIRNAIVMSNNAGGFAHGFVGTDGPVDIGVGNVEARWIWGRLGQSEWFDPTVTRTDRFLTGVVLSYAPSFLDGLAVGATRVFYGLVPVGGVPFGDYFMVLSGVQKSALVSPSNPTGDDEQDQLLSLFFRWTLAESGFEVFGEWARNDHAWDLTDFILEPEHSQAYTLGLQKTVPLDEGRMLSLSGELTHLERSRTRELRASPVYYTHHLVTQGYTHNGQVIGAGIGPGGNAQHAGVDLYAPWGRAGVYLQRDVHDNDAYYAYAQANGLDFCCHDVSLRFGSHALYFAGSFELGGGLDLTREFNRYFFGDEVWNLSLGLNARWRAR